MEWFWVIESVGFVIEFVYWFNLFLGGKVDFIGKFVFVFDWFIYNGNECWLGVFVYKSKFN